MDGLEYELWEILNGVKSHYYRHMVTQEELQQLKVLSEQCGCWIIFDDESEETALDLESWKKRFEKQKGATR
ncbi:hypothetical protein GCM10011511_40160 [Puia dinghuensis]|uniref:Uncharacterized protein n=1 Tax=Puia dinghuensis TaxID=1792502 RepID=A0A8J2XSV7_9BACT|nr:hypothetical protein GCM10011511_40160 [Puia dinghuensis]